MGMWNLHAQGFFDMKLFPCPLSLGKCLVAEEASLKLD